MTTEAKAYLHKIENLYAAAGRPNHSVWYFDAGHNSAVHSELAALGLLSKVLGTERGYAWRLTAAGVGQILAQA
ncbi:MAG TPA: hypothetical protein VK745_04220 [Polyangiaceae bacterium]|jgi:hypothetical protein|nr:hypothetical protein [Polyangiaceae bacterium]